MPPASVDLFKAFLGVLEQSWFGSGKKELKKKTNSESLMFPSLDCSVVVLCVLFVFYIVVLRMGRARSVGCWLADEFLLDPCSLFITLAVCVSESYFVYSARAK